MSQFPPRAVFAIVAAETATGPAPETSGQPGPPRIQFLSLPDVLTRLTISRSLLYELMKDPVRPFPAPVHIGRRSVWVEEEIEAWMLDVIKITQRSRAN